MQEGRRTGFTLVELAFVLAVIGILVSLTVPAYEFSVRRAHAAEATLTLHQIAHAQLAHRRDRGRYVECAPSGAEVPRGAAVTFDGEAAGWRELAFAIEGPVRYRYSVTLADGSFRAVAQGDLDGDGSPSTFTLDGKHLQIDAQDPLE